MATIGKKVVIGYHRTNRDLVYRLDQDLVKRGVQIWIDTRDIRPADSRRQASYEAIAGGDFFLACLSPEFLADGFCRTQLFLARAYNKNILPVLVSESWPGDNVVLNFMQAGMKHSHAIKGIEELFYLDFSGRHDTWSGGSYEKNFERLVEGIQPVPKPVPLNADLTYFSYNWNDTEFANRLARDVQLARGQIWIDTFGIRVGDNWRAAMYSGLRTADQLVVCLSPEAVQSENVMHEVLLARMRGLRILPVVSERVHQSEVLKKQLEASLEQSTDMRFLMDLMWLEPQPDYNGLVATLKLAIGLTETRDERKDGIFLSYRRADSQAMTGRIHEKLVEAFGPDSVFMDVDTIPPGEDFAKYYQTWLRRDAAVMLVIIGKTWASLKNESDNDGLPRLHDEEDHVRIEVSSAIEMGSLRVIPVLIGGAQMPQGGDLPETLRGLLRLNAISVRYDPDFGRDIAKLIDALRDR